MTPTSAEPPESLEPLRGQTRILVYGVTGSGKSTLAAKLSQRSGLPWYAVDDLTWNPGWVPVADDIQRQRIGDICARDSWILDAAYGKWLDIPASRVQLIIGLDYPRWLSFARLLRRTATHIALRRTTCNGNRETIRNSLAADSILRWHFRSFARKRERIRQWAADPLAPQLLVFSTPAEAAAWLDTVEPVRSGSDHSSHPDTD